jgi:large subunit ribosomal protein L19
MQATIIDKIEKSFLREGLPEFRVGDTCRIHYRIREGEKERVQVFQGVVIKRHRAGARSTFTVRKVSFNIGVERVFLQHSPRIEKIEVISHGVVRRARLFYLRELAGKAARLRDAKDKLVLLRLPRISLLSAPSEPLVPGALRGRPDDPVCALWWRQQPDRQVLHDLRSPIGCGARTSSGWSSPRWSSPSVRRSGWSARRS